MSQKIRKERITKVEWYQRGGFANSDLFRLQSRGGAWRYYRVIPDKDQINRAFDAGIKEGFDILRQARDAGRKVVIEDSK